MLQLENLTLGSFQTNRRSVIHVKFFSMMSSAMRCPAFATAQSCAKGVKGGAKDDDELGMDTCHRWVSKYSVKFLSSQLIIDNRVLNSPIYGHAVLFRFSPWYFSSFYLQCDRQLYPTYYHESRSEECPNKVTNITPELSVSHGLHPNPVTVFQLFFNHVSCQPEIVSAILKTARKPFQL